jgi:hypothetical protein
LIVVNCERPALNETDYSPGKVAYYIARWPELLEEAIVTPRSSSQFSAEPGSSGNVNPFHAAIVVVDIERAWIQLGRWSLEFQMVEWSMKRPLSTRHNNYLVSVADSLRVSLHDANNAYHRACRQMAETLGWRG